MNWQVQVRAQVGALELEVDIGGDERPVVLVGPNGSGKTTLLRIIAGALAPSAGHIRVGPLTSFDSDQALSLPPEQRRVGYVPQGYGLFPHLRVVDNVAFGLAREPRRDRRRTAMQLLERLGCAALADRLPAGLSGGEQQRIALARALVVEPELLLLDEPLSALDATTRRSMRAFLVEHLAARHKPAIVVTHDLRDVLALGAEVFVLEAGRMTQRGTASELRERPATDFVAELFDLAPGSGSDRRPLP